MDLTEHTAQGPVIGATPCTVWLRPRALEDPRVIARRQEVIQAVLPRAVEAWQREQEERQRREDDLRR